MHARSPRDLYSGHRAQSEELSLSVEPRWPLNGEGPIRPWPSHFQSYPVANTATLFFEATCQHDKIFINTKYFSVNSARDCQNAFLSTGWRYAFAMPPSLPVCGSASGRLSSVHCQTRHVMRGAGEENAELSSIQLPVDNNNNT